MRRREFIALMGGAAATWPLRARAQQSNVPVVAFFEATASAAGYEPMLAAFHQGLGESGFVTGRDVTVEYHWAASQPELNSIAADLVRREVAVIAVGGLGAVRAAKAATARIPIVFRLAPDPVAAGLVASLSRPGGNLTGVVTLAAELTAKRLELLHELLSSLSRVALLTNPANVNTEPLVQQAQQAAPSFGLKLHVLGASTLSDLDGAFIEAHTVGSEALLILADGFFNSNAERLAILSARQALPTIFQYRRFAAAGGLISYGSSLTDAYRLAGVYTGRVLKGAKPADLPVQQSTKIELIINLKTAKALGITVPSMLLARADEVIE